MALNARRRLGFSYVAGTLRVPSASGRSQRNSRTLVTAPPKGYPARLRHGFTLVELLVVIAIIGMLVALLLPAVHSVRERARQTQCLNNIKNIALAVVSYDSSKGQPPGLTQFVKQGQSGTNTNYADVVYDNQVRRFTVKTTTIPTNSVPGTFNGMAGLSWATMLLPKLERGDIWDSIVTPPDPTIAVPMPPLAVFVCPSDTDVNSQPDVAGLTYSANSGGWDRLGTNFLWRPNATPAMGDTADNGVFFDYASFDRQAPAIPVASRPVTRISNIKDGSGTTLMLAENVHKSYLDPSNRPLFSWLAGSEGLPTLGGYPSEQQLGFVWVVPSSGTAPVPGNTEKDQERIGGNIDKAGDFDPRMPRFARPASNHGSGANVAYCDGHSSYLRDDIDYIVYVQLMTPNGRKCVNPAGWTPVVSPITDYRGAPPLAEKDL